MKGFEEFPTPEILVRDKSRGGCEQWLDWFGSSIHIDDYELNRYCHPIPNDLGIPIRYVLSARTDEMSRIMIECFGTDFLYLNSTTAIATRLQRILHKMDYTRFGYKNYEVVR